MLRASERGTRVQVLFLRIDSISDWIAGIHLDESSPLVAALNVSLSLGKATSRAVAFHHSEGDL